MTTKKLTTEERKRLEKEAKKRGYAPDVFIDMVTKGIAVFADPIPPVRWLFGKKKK